MENKEGMKLQTLCLFSLVVCGFWFLVLTTILWLRPSKQTQLDCAYSEAVIQGKDESARRLLAQGASPRGVCVVGLPVREWTWGTTYYVRGNRTIREEKRLWVGMRTVLKDKEDW